MEYRAGERMPDRDTPVSFSNSVAAARGTTPA